MCPFNPFLSPALLPGPVVRPPRKPRPSRGSRKVTRRPGRRQRAWPTQRRRATAAEKGETVGTTGTADYVATGGMGLTGCMIPPQCHTSCALLTRLASSMSRRSDYHTHIHAHAHAHARVHMIGHAMIDTRVGAHHAGATAGRAVGKVARRIEEWSISDAERRSCCRTQ